MDTVPHAVLTEKYRQLRDLKDALAKLHTEQLRPIRDAMEAIEAHFLQVMLREGMSSIKTDGGTAYQQTRTSYKIDDPSEFRAWVEQNNRPDFYENRPSKDTLEAWVAAGNPLPPGVVVNSEVRVNIRK